MAGPDVKSNLGAFAEYGQLAADDELVALDALGVFMGSLGDLGGAVAVVVGLLDLLGLMGSENQTAIDRLGRELDKVDKELRALIGDEHAQHLLDRLRGLDAIAAPAQTAFDRIVALLPPNPPPSADTIN